MIYSHRLRFRAAEREDVPRFVTWLNDPDVRRHLSLIYPLSRAEEEEWFNRMLKSPAAEHVMVIEIRQGDGWKPIGNISLMDIQWIERSAELGLFIGEKEEWGKGYGTEAVKLLLRHGFQTLNLHRIFLRVHEDNLRGIRAYERAGFIHEGRLRQAVYREGLFYDMLIMSVLRDEWQDGDQSLG